MAREPAAAAAVLAAGESKLGRLSARDFEELLTAASAPPAERAEDETAVLAHAMRCVPVLASLPDEERARLCATATYEQYEEHQHVASFGGDGGPTDRAHAVEPYQPPHGRTRGLCILLFGELLVTRGVGNAGAGNGTGDGAGSGAGGGSGGGSGGAAPVQLLMPGDHFGDNALLHKAFQNCTVRATERSGVLCFSEAEFRQTLRRSKIEKEAEKAIFVASVPMFAKLPWERLLKMNHRLQPREFPRGAVLLAQGDTPPGLFVVQDGRLVVLREMQYVEGGRQRTRRMHLETLMPRDTYGGDAMVHGLLRSRTTLMAETDVTVLFMSRTDFAPSLLTEDALRMLKLNAKLYRPDDELLLQRHYHELEWDRAKRHFVKEVLSEARDKRKLKALLSGNPSTMKRGEW